MSDHQAGDLCAQCGHASGSHCFVATSNKPGASMPDPLLGGIRLCPEPQCQCFATWSPSHPDLPTITPWVPPRDEIEYLREQIQQIEDPSSGTRLN